MMWMFLLSAITAFVLVGIMVFISGRFGLLDTPGPRSSHSAPTPTGAGVALVSALWIAGWLYPLLPLSAQTPVFPGWITLLLVPAALLCLVGFVDDHHPLSARLRLLVQLGAALYLLLGLHDSLSGTPWLVLPGLFALLWTMNAYNFMDGSNGMAGMQGLFSGALMSVCLLLADAPVLGLATAAIAGACAGFLPWNVPRARIFLGDAGSVPLGFLFAGLGLLAYLGGYLSLPVVLLTVLTFHIDAGLTLLTRMVNKERWYTAHRRHVYQRLLVHGWSHSQVLMLYLALNLIVIAPATLLGTLHGQWAWALMMIATVILVLAWFAVSLRLGESA